MAIWTKRLIIVVPGGPLNAARKNAMGQIFVDDGSGESLADESLMFSVRLSESGDEPATHFGANTVATDNIDTNLRGYVDGNFLPGAKWWQLNPSTELLEAKSSGASGTIGLAWTFQDALDDSGDFGMIRIEPAL